MNEMHLFVQTIPAWFVRAFADKFESTVQVQYDRVERWWPVNVNVDSINQKPHVSFGKGWKKFCKFHDIGLGDVLKFNLVGFSCFIVTRERLNLASHFDDMTEADDDISNYD